jgi:benzil reductase ((S)-benzoin forming)
MSFARYTVTDSRPALALVTGGRSGIGKAIADKIAAFPFIEKVLLVSRSIQPNDVPDNPKFVAVAADIGSEEGRRTIVQQVEHHSSTTSNTTTTSKSKRPLRFLVHSAGTIDPIKSILDVTQEELSHAMLVNLQGPILLSTALYPYLSSSSDNNNDAAGRILHVSSGAAHGPPPVGWSVYGISKAAFFQAFQTMDKEFVHLGGRVRVGSFKPGVVDTPMQGVIRDTSENSMPMVETFRTMKAKVVDVAPHDTEAHPPPSGALDSPKNVAFFAEWLLLGTGDDEFANRDDPNEYDIRNKELFPKWIPAKNLPKEN